MGRVAPPRVSNYGSTSELLRWVDRTETALQERAAEPGTEEAMLSCAEAGFTPNPVEAVRSVALDCLFAAGW